MENKEAENTFTCDQCGDLEYIELRTMTDDEIALCDVCSSAFDVK